MTDLVRGLVGVLKSKPLDEYSLVEMQKSLSDIVGVWKRVKNTEDRDLLNNVWNKIAEWYNVSVKRVYPSARDVYKIDYLKNEVK